MGSSYKALVWSLRAGGLVDSRPLVQGTNLIDDSFTSGGQVVGTPGGPAFNDTADPNLNFPVYWIQPNMLPTMGSIGAPPPYIEFINSLAGLVSEFGTKGSLPRLPKSVEYYPDFGLALTSGVHPDVSNFDHFNPFAYQFGPALSRYGIQSCLGERLFPGVPALKPATTFVMGDHYFIYATDLPFFVRKWNHFDNYRRIYSPIAFTKNPNFTDTYTSTSFFPGSTSLDTVGTAAQSWAAAAKRYRNFHGLVCLAKRAPPNIQPPPWDASSSTPTTPALILTFDPVTHEPDGYIYSLPNVDKDNDEAAKAVQTFFDAYSGVVPPNAGDCSWEMISIPTDADFTFFLQRVKAWYGLV